MKSVRKAVSKLKQNKSPWFDSLPHELFIDMADLLVDALCKLFNYMFVNSLYPEKWTRGIVPFPKKGGISDVNNYRSITLTNIFSKIYLNILDNRFHTWADDINILNESQFGFMQNKSTTRAGSKVMQPMMLNDN